MTGNSKCGRPSNFCNGAGQQYSETDCDGDGVLDPTCEDGSGNGGSILSNEGCKNTWPAGRYCGYAKDVPTCLMYNAPRHAVKATALQPGSFKMDATGPAAAPVNVAATDVFTAGCAGSGFTAAQQEVAMRDLATELGLDLSTMDFAQSTFQCATARSPPEHARAKRAPLKSQCYVRKVDQAPAARVSAGNGAAQGETTPAAAAKSCFVEMERDHSETTCRPVVPKVDRFGGVNWKKKGSTGELFNNRRRLDKIYYGPGKNGPNSFDWEGWTIPLVSVRASCHA